MLFANGVSLDECYLTGIRKYEPWSRHPKDILKVAEGEPSLDTQIAQFQQEIASVKPNCILIFGPYALKLLFGTNKITQYRGSILRYCGTKVIPTFHIDAIYGRNGYNFAGWYQKYIMEFDVKKAVTESKTSSFDLPVRNLVACKSYHELYSYLMRFDKTQDWDLDIEAYKCIPSCIALAPSPHTAISVPLFNNIAGLQLSSFSEAERIQIWSLLAQFLQNKKFRTGGHNFKYDQEKLEMLQLIVKNFYFDTMLAAHAICPELPKSLAFQASILTREPYWKEEGSEFNPKTDSIDRLFLYNAKDAAVTSEVRRAQIKEIERLHLQDFFYNFLMPQHDLYRYIESVGLRVDSEARRELIEKYCKRRVEKEYELYKILGYELNVNSPKQVAICLYKGMGFPEREGTGEETLVALMANHAKTPEQVRVMELIIEIRKIRKTIGTYLLANPDYDGRMRCSYRIDGTETGRTSTAIMESPIRPDSLGIAFQTMTKHGDVGSDLRTMFITDKGYIDDNGNLQVVRNA